MPQVSQSLLECLYFYPDFQRWIQPGLGLEEVRCRKARSLLLCPLRARSAASTLPKSPPPGTLALACLLGSAPSVLLSPASAQRPSRAAPASRTHRRRPWKSVPSSTPTAGHTLLEASRHPPAGGTPWARESPHLLGWPHLRAHRVCHREVGAELPSP